MWRNLPSEYRIFKGEYYPYKRGKQSLKPYHRVVLGIGGNVGDVRRRFNHLFIYLQRDPFVDILESSPILKNPPFGYLDQADFYNALLLIKTSLEPKALLRYILSVEKRFGRKRSFQDAPRTLDIDIIFYEDKVCSTPQLRVPHHGWRERDSVLIPLSMMKSRYIREKYEQR